MKGISQSSVSIHSRHSKRMRKNSRLAGCGCAASLFFVYMFVVTASRRRITGRKILTSVLYESVCRFSCGCE